MFASWSLVALLAVFAAGAAAVWVAGVYLANTTDVLSSHFGLGHALGGVILLAIATNLPEIAITASAASAGTMDVAVGNILGGIALQTVVLVLLDAFGMKEKTPLTSRAASLTLVIEGLLVVAVLILSIMGTQMPPSLIVARLTPIAVLIAILWVAGVWLIGRAHLGLPWHAKWVGAAGVPDKPAADAQPDKDAPSEERRGSTVRAILIFAAAALVTLVAGVVLEVSGNAIADRVGMSGVLFGATVLAAATSLPELSTGLTATRSGDYELAISDIFGGNAFLPVLFLLATLVSGRAVLPQAHATDIYLAGLGVLLTSVYLAGLIFRHERRVLGMGVDSLVVLVLYLTGIAGLIAVTHGGHGH